MVGSETQRVLHARRQQIFVDALNEAPIRSTFLLKDKPQSRTADDLLFWKTRQKWSNPFRPLSAKQ